MNEKALKRFFMIAVWIIAIFLIFFTIWFVSHIEELKSDPCKVCEELGNTCTREMQVVEGLPQLHFEKGGYDVGKGEE